MDEHIVGFSLFTGFVESKKITLILNKLIYSNLLFKLTHQNSVVYIKFFTFSLTNVWGGKKE